MQKSVWEKVAVLLDSLLWRAILVGRELMKPDFLGLCILSCSWTPWLSVKVRTHLKFFLHLSCFSLMLSRSCIIKYEIILHPPLIWGIRECWALIFKKLRLLKCENFASLSGLIDSDHGAEMY